MVSLISIVAAVVVLLIDLLFGFWRGFKKSLLRLGTVALALVAAIPLTDFLVQKEVELAPTLAGDLFASNATVVEITEAAPSIMDSVVLLASRLSAPVLFVDVFLVCFLCSFVLYLILRYALFMVFRRDKMPHTHLLGAVTGVLIALLVIEGGNGTLSRTVSLVTPVAEEAEGFLSEDALAVFDTIVVETENLAHSPILVVTGAMGGNALYAHLTGGAELNGEAVVLEDEFAAFTATVASAKALRETDFANLTDADLEALDAVVLSAGDAVTLRNILAEVLAAAATEWGNDRTFAGLKNPLSDMVASLVDLETYGEMGKTAEQSFYKKLYLDWLSTTTKDTVVADAGVLLKLLSAISANSGAETEVVLDALSAVFASYERTVAVGLDKDMNSLKALLTTPSITDTIAKVEQIGSLTDKLDQLAPDTSKEEAKDVIKDELHDIFGTTPPVEGEEVDEEYQETIDNLAGSIVDVHQDPEQNLTDSDVINELMNEYGHLLGELPPDFDLDGFLAGYLGQ